MRIPETYLDRLRAAGLLVSEPYAPDHSIPDGVVVAKPASLPGIVVPEMEVYWAPTGELLDAPTLILLAEPGKWAVVSHDYIPGPGPGDFVNVWPSPEGAVADILDFYFGDPHRIEIKGLGDE